MSLRTGIYKIENTLNGHIYVGSAVDLAMRWVVHRCKLSKNMHHSRKLQHAWNRDGSQAFLFAVLELCSKEELAVREQVWMDALKAVSKCGYNILPFARTGIGRIATPETRVKNAAAARGRKHSVECRLKMSLARIGKPNPHTVTKGRKHSEDTKMRLRQIALARPTNWEALRKAHDAVRGRKQDPAIIAARAKRQVGSKRSIETRQKMSIAQKEKPRIFIRDNKGRILSSHLIDPSKNVMAV